MSYETVKRFVYIDAGTGLIELPTDMPYENKSKYPPYVLASDYESLEAELDATLDSAEVQAKSAWDQVKSLAWQPIDTAPKDDTQVLLWWDGRYLIGSFIYGKFSSTEDYDPDGQPTNWCPLPDPPQ
jgi:hypothetical protein